MNPQTVGDRIKAAREAHQTAHQAPKRTITAFARLLRIAAPSLHNLESGKSAAPSAETLLRMRDLGLNIDYIIRGRGQPLCDPAVATSDPDLIAARDILSTLDNRSVQLWFAIGKLLHQELSVSVEPAAKQGEAADEFAELWERSRQIQEDLNKLRTGGDRDKGRLGGNSRASGTTANRDRRKA